MKRIIIYLLLCLLIPSSAFSQSTYPKLLNDSLVVITVDQLKQSNQVFLEHGYLKQTNGLLTSQLKDYEALVANYEESDSIQRVQIGEYAERVKQDNVLINKLEADKAKYRRRSKIKSWFIGTFATSTAVLALLMTL